MPKLHIKHDLGFVLVSPRFRFLFLALLRSDVDRKPVICLYRVPTRRGVVFLFRPFGGMR